MRVGFIGLGIMGTPMAKNVLRAGFELTVWNRDGLKCAPLAEAGAKVAVSPRAVARDSDVVLAMVADPKAAREVALGHDGVVEGLSPGAGYIDFSTVDPETPRLVAEAVRARGGLFLEAPVSGSKKPAEEGALILLCGGDAELFERAAPLFAVLGKRSMHLGQEGNGARMKLVVNQIMGAMMAALSEGVALADRAGLDASTLLAVLDEGVMANPLFRLKGPALLCSDFPPAFPLKHMQKDLGLALALADALGQNLPVAEAVNLHFLEALGKNLGDADFSAIHEVVGK